MRASDRAYEALREDILQWRLPPGTLLAEVEQSVRLGVSRTPIREALARLTSEGLTAPRGGRGAVVTDISVDHLGELFELRGALECRAAELAARRGDPSLFAGLETELLASREATAASTDHTSYYALVGRLDSAIDAAAGNSYLSAALKNLRVHLTRIRRLAQDDPDRLAAAATEHAAIAAAIAAGNPVLASAATTIHLHNSLGYLLAAGTPSD
jgi:DNA-binding GntR family transcriptional regulator